LISDCVHFPAGNIRLDVEGFWAVENGAATDLLIEADHSGARHLCRGQCSSN